MQLELATVLSCHPDGCVVQPLARATPLPVCYAPPVKDRIRIWRGDLVVIDRADADAQLVWRWHAAEVLRPLGQELPAGHVLVGARGNCVEAQVAQPGLVITPGDQVWVEHSDRGFDVLDRAVDGKPQHPPWIERERFPLIEATYAAWDAG